MKNIINCIVVITSIIIYIILLFLTQLNHNNIQELFYISLVAIPCLMLLINSFSVKDKNKRKKTLYVYFIMYLVTLIEFTFSSSRVNEFTLNGIMHHNYNLIPFYSMFSLLTSPFGIKFSLYNIMGNILMLTPLAIFLPLINDKFNNLKNFILTVFSFTLFIEITQFIVNRGSFMWTILF